MREKQFEYDGINYKIKYDCIDGVWEGKLYQQTIKGEKIKWVQCILKHSDNDAPFLTVEGESEPHLIKNVRDIVKHKQII